MRIVPDGTFASLYCLPKTASVTPFDLLFRLFGRGDFVPLRLLQLAFSFYSGQLDQPRNLGKCSGKRARLL